MFRVSGCTDYFAKTEQEAFEMGRASVAAFNFNSIPVNTSVKEPVYNADELVGIIPVDGTSHLDIYKVILVFFTGYIDVVLCTGHLGIYHLVRASLHTVSRTSWAFVLYLVSVLKIAILMKTFYNRIIRVVLTVML